MKSIEKIARQLCRGADIDPDSLVGAGIPFSFEVSGRRFYVLPPAEYTVPAWTEFVSETKQMLDILMRSAFVADDAARTKLNDIYYERDEE